MADRAAVVNVTLLEEFTTLEHDASNCAPCRGAASFHTRVEHHVCPPKPETRCRRDAALSCPPTSLPHTHALNVALPATVSTRPVVRQLVVTGGIGDGFLQRNERVHVATATHTRDAAELAIRCERSTRKTRACSDAHAHTTNGSAAIRVERGASSWRGVCAAQHCARASLFLWQVASWLA